MPKLKPDTDAKELGTRAIAIFLGAVLIVAFILRVVYPFNTVFGYGFTNFLETDAWNRMMYARDMAGMGFFQSIGFMVHNNLLFSWIVSVFGRVFPLEQVGAWLPPLMGVGVVAVVFFIGKAVFSKNVGLVGALFVAVIPSEFLHRSLLGFADHHVLEVLLLALFVLFLIKAIQKGKAWSKWTWLAGFTICLYALNWKSGIYVLAVFLAALLVIFVARNKFMRETWHAGIYPVAALAGIGLALYLPIGGWAQFSFVAGNVTLSATTTEEIVNTFTAPLSQRTISEIMPLLWPYGQFDIGVVVSNLHFFAFTFLIGLVLCWKLRANRLVLVFALFSLFMLALTLNERRFLYYLTLSVGILSAFTIFELARRLKGNVIANAMVFTLPLLLVSLPFAKGIAAVQPFPQVKEWHQALTWLKDQPEENGRYVSAWTDYGHWIKYVSGDEPNYLPGPGGDLIAKTFLSTDNAEVQKLLDEMKTSYLILDEDTLKGKYRALQVVAGETVPIKDSFLYKALEMRQYPLYLTLAYESETLKIFRYGG